MGIKSISIVKTVEQFWTTYNYLRRPNDLSSTTDYHFFRDGIKPTWEDPKNAKGGKWIIRLPKGLASRYWEEVILALIGGQFPGITDGEICGLVISIRYSEDILGIWNKSASDRDVVDRLRTRSKRCCSCHRSRTGAWSTNPTKTRSRIGRRFETPKRGNRIDRPRNRYPTLVTEQRRSTLCLVIGPGRGSNGKIDAKAHPIGRGVHR